MEPIIVELEEGHELKETPAKPGRRWIGSCLVLAGEQQDLPEEEENYLAGRRNIRWQMAEILADSFKRMNENLTCNNGAEGLASFRRLQW
jgi:hypothetical protein